MFLKNLREDVRAVLARDPAARSFWEVALCYPGIQALAAHRLAAWLWRHGWKLTARWLSQVARTFTGIEIHPGARIGRRLFIDHGMGVVIGATAEVGDDCTLYQGVTLGGTALHQGKRHPTLGNEVIVGAGAQVLGGFTVGDGARIGANAVVVSAVPADATVVGIPGKPVLRGNASAAERATADAATGAGRSPASSSTPATIEGPAPHHPPFMPYGTPCDDVADTVEHRLGALLDEVAGLRRRVAELEARPMEVRPAELQPVAAKDGPAPYLVAHDDEAAAEAAVPRVERRF